MRRIAIHLGRVVLIVFLSGLACALLARFSPGSTVDERELNPKAGEDSIAELRHHKESTVADGLVQYFRGLSKGDLGYSESTNAPIAALIADRAPPTLRELAWGLLGGWLFGLAFAIPAGRFERAAAYDAVSALGAGFLLSLPAALIAYLCFLAGAAPAIILVLVVAPKIFQFSKGLLRQAYTLGHVEAARARGIGELRIFFAHVLPAAGPQWIALAAASLSIAIGAAIPMEAICDIPGLGRLAWQAATARDLPLLVNLTMLIAIVTSAGAALSEIVSEQRI
ncbi:MAG: ABC transporter permease [Acidobacteriia bacterium]|nr:ABC transporter permease [Terriglobia bacterium]